jgi:Cd2+/Zn2+-exporting ATPase
MPSRHVQAVALDKTGTLTTGKLTCSGIEQLSGPELDQRSSNSHRRLFRTACRPSDRRSPDLLCRSRATSQTLQVERLPLELLAMGLKALFLLILRSSASASSSRKNLKQPFPSPIKMATYLWVQGSLFVFHFTDTLRANTQKKLWNSSKKSNLRVIMLTGDHQSSAHAKSHRDLGIEEGLRRPPS